MAELDLQALMDHFDTRVPGKTAAVGIVARIEGERILRWLLTAYLRDQGWSIGPVVPRRPKTLTGPVLDEAIVADHRDGRRRLFVVEYKFWTSSSLNYKSIPKDCDIGELAYKAWHEKRPEWQGSVSHETFLGWTEGAKILSQLDRETLPDGHESREIQPVLAVWQPMATHAVGAGVCWTEALLEGDWHQGQGYDLTLAVFSGSLFARAHPACTIPVDPSSSEFAATIVQALDIATDLIVG